MKLIGTLILTMSVMACSPNNSSTNPAKKVTQPKTTPLPTTTKGSDVLTTSPNSSSSTKTADKVTPLVVMQTPSSPISVANIPTVSASFQTCQASVAVKTNTNNPLEAMSLESAALDWLKSLGYVRGGNTSEIELELHHDEEDGSGCSAIEVNRRCHVTAKISSDKKEPKFLTGSAEKCLKKGELAWESDVAVCQEAFSKVALKACGGPTPNYEEPILKKDYTIQELGNFFDNERVRSADYKVKKIEILQKCDHLCAKLFVEQLTEIRLHFTDTLLGNPIMSFNLENSGIVDIIEEFSRRNQKCLQNFSRNGRWTAISAIPLTPEYDAFYVGLKFSSCPNETLNLLITNDGKNVKASTWLHPVEIERELGEWNPRRYSYVIRKIVAPGKFRFRFSHFDIGKRGLIESYTPVFTSPRFSDLNGSTLVRGSDSYSDWVGVRWTGTDIVFDGFYNTSSGESFTLPELLGKPLKAGLELYTYFADDSLILLEDGNQLTSFKFSELSKNNSSKTAKWSFDASILANVNQTFNIVNMLDANLFIGIRKNKQFPAPAYAGEVLPTPQELVIFSLDNGGAVKLKLLTQLNKFSDGTFIFYNRGLSYKEGKFRFETMLLDSIWNSKRTIYKTFEIDVSTLEVRQLEVRVVEY